MKQWYSGNDVMRILNVSADEICSLIQKGLLKPYRRLGNSRALNAIYELDRIPGVDKDILESQDLCIPFAALPLKGINYYVGLKKEDIGKKIYFQQEEVEQFAQDYGFEVQGTEQTLPSQPQEDQPAPVRESTATAENYFHREGPSWRIGFQGERGTFHDYLYTRCVVMILERKRRESISAAQLVRALNNTGEQLAKTSEVRATSEDIAMDERLSFDSIEKDEEVSAKQISKVEKLLAEKESETDPVVKQEIQDQIDKEVSFLTSLNSIASQGADHPMRKPRKRRIDDYHGKKAQNDVKGKLKSAYRALDKGGLKKLAKHLRDTVRTDGSYGFVYRGSEEIVWEIKW